jgi:hypothetical protein
MSIVFAQALKKCTGAKATQIKKAKKTIDTMDPQQIKALETIAKLSKQAEGRSWGKI